MTDICRVCKKECPEKFRPCRCQRVVHPICLQTQLKDQYDRSRCRVCQYQFQVGGRRYRFIGWKRFWCNPWVGFLVSFPLQVIIPLIWRFDVYFGLITFQISGGFWIWVPCFLSMFFYLGIIISNCTFFLREDGFRLYTEDNVFRKFYLDWIIWVLLQFGAHVLGYLMLRFVFIKYELAGDHPGLHGLSFITYSVGMFIYFILLILGVIIYSMYKCIEIICQDRCCTREKIMLPA